MTTAIATAKRFVYFFGEGHADGGGDLKHLVGGKGASLADMTRAQLNVPPGFTISAECCDLWYRSGKPASRKRKSSTPARWKRFASDSATSTRPTPAGNCRPTPTP